VLLGPAEEPGRDAAAVVARLVDEFPEIKYDVASELADRAERANQGDTLYEDFEESN
jgi:hypothetical protein